MISKLSTVFMKVYIFRIYRQWLIFSQYLSNVVKMKQSDIFLKIITKILDLIENG